MARYLITHAGPGLFDCSCDRSSVTGSDGVARLTLTDTVEASSLGRAQQGVDRRCLVVEVVAAAERRAA